MAHFKATQGMTPVSVDVNDNGVQVTAGGNTYKFDADLKPLSLDKSNSTVTYRDNEGATLAKLKAVCEDGHTIPQAFDGKDGIANALAIVADVAAQQATFPKEIAAKVPQAYTNLGLEAPARQIG